MRLYVAAAAGVAGRALLWLDAHVAALLPGDRRPLIDIACCVAAWLGRTWRRCLAEVHTRPDAPAIPAIALTEKKESCRG